jgi:hypothetical protein
MWFTLFAACFKMEAILSSQMLVDFCQTTQHYIPEDKLFTATAVGTSNPTTSISIFHSIYYKRIIFFLGGGELCPK